MSKILNIILRRKTPYGIRKKYDKLREKIDRGKDVTRRMTLLHHMDQIEPMIIALEEGTTPDFQVKKMMKYLDEKLKNVGRMIKDEKSTNPMIKNTNP